MELKTIRLSIPEGCNLIVGQSHFIKTAEDLYEVLSRQLSPRKVRHRLLRGIGPLPHSNRGK